MSTMHFICHNFELQFQYTIGVSEVVQIPLFLEACDLRHYGLIAEMRPGMFYSVNT
jgi:hypothetical protein